MEACGRAHRVTLKSDCLVVERDEYTGLTTKCYHAVDQYGARYNGVAEAPATFPANQVHIPLNRVSMQVVSMDTLPEPLWMAKQHSGCAHVNLGECCFEVKLEGSVFVVQAEMGQVKLNVAMVDLGPNHEAKKFLDHFEEVKKAYTGNSAEVEAAYESWFMQRLNAAGTMSGNTPFLKAIAPIPASACVQTETGFFGGSSHTIMTAGTHVRWTEGHGIFAHCGQETTPYLNNQDRIVNVKGAAVEGVSGAGVQMATSTANSHDLMITRTAVPVFQPCTVKTIGPFGGLTWGTDISVATTAPPTIVGVAANAATSGLQPGDIILKLVADGQTHEAAGMTGEMFQGLVSRAGSWTLTVASQAGISGKSASFPNSSSQRRALPWIPCEQAARCR